MTWGNSSGRHRRPSRRRLCAASRKRLQPPAPRLPRRPRHVVPRHRQLCRRLLRLQCRSPRSRLRRPPWSSPPRQRRSPRLRPLRWLRLLPSLHRGPRPRQPAHVRPRPHPARQPQLRPPLRLRRYGRRQRTPARPPGPVPCPVPAEPVDCLVASASPAHRVRATTRSPRARVWACSVPVPKVPRRPPAAAPASVPSALTVPAVRARPETACRGPVAALPACRGRTRP